MYSWLSIHLKSCLTVPGHAYRYKSWNERTHLPHQKEKWTDETKQWYNTLRLRKGIKMEKLMESIYAIVKRACQDHDRLFLGSQRLNDCLVLPWRFNSLFWIWWETTDVDKKIGKCSCWINAQLLEHNWHMRVFVFQDNCNQIVLL